MRTHCRCRKCRRRRVLPRAPAEYENPPTCNGCGGPLVVDAWANARPWRRLVCECDAYHYPHKRDSGACVISQRQALAPELPGDGRDYPF